jgi:hypothetical protein
MDKVVVTKDAEADLDEFIKYLLFEKSINFLNHRYFMMYRIVGNVVFVDNIFHELQDYENKMY